MPWDLTADEAEKFNAIAGGGKVDLTPEEAQKFQPIFAERAKVQKPEPGLGSLALSALKEMGSSLVNPSVEESSSPLVNAQDQALAALSSFDIGIRPGNPARAAEIDRAFELAQKRFPKTALAAGLLAPFPTKVKEQMLVSGGLGALHGFQTAKPGEELSSALLGGGINAALAGVLGKTIEGGGKLLGPAARKLLARMGVKAEQLSAEAATVVEHPLDRAARETAAIDARGGEPATISTQPPTNLAQVWQPPEARAVLPAEPKTAPGEPLDVLARLRKRGALGGEPLPGENIEASLAKIEELGAERPTVRETSPQWENALRDSGYYEAISAAARGDTEPLKAWFRNPPKTPQGMELSQAVELLGKDLAGEHRVRAGAVNRTLPATIEDVRGTVNQRAKATAEPSVDEGLAWLTGEDVGTADTHVKYVPKDINAPEVFGRDPEATLVPRGQAPGSEMFIGGGAGSRGGEPRAAALPHGGPPVSEPFSQQDVTPEFLANAAASQKLLEADEGLRAKFVRNFFLPENRGSELLGHAVRSVQASAALGEARVKYFFPAMDKALRALPKSERVATANTVKALRDGKATLADVSRLPAKFRDLFEQSQKELQSQMVQLARGGYFAPQELGVMAQNLRDAKLWQHRSYHAFTSRQTWKPKADAIDQAARFFMGAKKVDNTEANRMVRELVKSIKASPERGGLKNADMLVGALRDAGITKGRKLPSQLRPLLGVIDDPAFIAADSAGQMATLFHLQARTKALMAPEFKGKIWNDVHLPNLDERPLWNNSLDLAGNKRLYGELAGKFVDPALRDAMTQLPPSRVGELANQLIKTVNGWFAISKVLTSPVTWARNFLSNGLYLAASGLADPVRQAYWVAKGMRALVAANKSGVGARAAGARDLVQMAIEDGALKFGRGTDFAGGSEARRIVELALHKSDGGLLGMMDSVYRGLVKARGRLGDAYEFFDQSARLAAYLYNLEKGRNVLKLKPLEARAHASHIVNRYFATGANVPPAFQRFKQLQVGAAPFMNWFVDNARVTKNLAADAITGRFGAPMRVAAWSAMPFAAAQLAYTLNGITDEDRAVAESMLKPSWKAQHPLHVWLPIRGADGKLVYAVSLDGINPMSVFAQGTDAMNPMQRVAAALGSGLTDSGALEPWTQDLLAEAGIKPKDYEPKLLPGQEGYKLGSSIASFLEPALMSKARNVARKAQLDVGEPLRPTEEPMALREAVVAQLSPLSVEKVGSRTKRGASKQLRGQRSELLDAKRQAGKLQDRNERSRVLEAVKERLRGLRHKRAE